MRRAIARIDLGAVERNVANLAARLEGGAELCAVVKAEGYGHGMVPCARAAIRGGAKCLAVATAGEARELRAALGSERIFVMGAMSPEEADEALAADAEVSVWSAGFAAGLARKAADLGVVPRVHVKYDSGMGRLGERDPQRVSQLIDLVATDEHLELAAMWTHFATADDDDHTFMHEQLERFRTLADGVKHRHPEIALHAANSAATIGEPAAHLDMVRCGIAIYGLDPFGRDPSDHGLEPALELTSWIADVKRFEAGASAGYGRTWRAQRDTLVGVIPIGYGDGYRRGLSSLAEVLVGGNRYPFAGTISMDNSTIDLGPVTNVEAGEEAVLIGARGGEWIRAEDLATVLGTINYEITCGISARVPREYVGASEE
ncbi:alanine racemase [soil metagenome]